MEGDEPSDAPETRGAFVDLHAGPKASEYQDLATNWTFPCIVWVDRVLVHPTSMAPGFYQVEPNERAALPADQG